MSLVSRYLESNGIPTVVIGSARDIVEHCGVARFLFTDFPLGNPCGHPWNREMQAAILEQGARLLETATVPRVTVRSSFEWKDDPGWRERYNRIRPEDREKLLALGAERRAKQARMAGRAG